MEPKIQKRSDNNTVNPSQFLSLERVSEYIEGHLNELPLHKQFHYLSRMYLWTHKEEHKKKLEAIKEEYFGSVEVLCKNARAIPQSTIEEGKNGGREYRFDTYTKHFRVYAYNAIFFKMLYIKTVYGSDEWKFV